MGIENFNLEKNSSQAVHMIRRETIEEWSCKYLLRLIWSMNFNQRDLHLIYREESKVADAIAMEAHQVEEWQEIFTSLELPIRIQKLLVFDRIGIPTLKHCTEGALFFHVGQQGF